MRKVFPRVIIISLITLLLSAVVPGTVHAAKSSAPATTPVGNDISWPQCGKTLPTNQAFGIVGVNGGLANTTNPCLATQLMWANNSTGKAPNQPKVQLYVNTANPGGLGTISWPTNNTDPAGNSAPNPYGTCDGTDSLPCAWQYGWNRAAEDILQRFTPAANTAGLSTTPADYIWWLDVETENTWKTGSSFATLSNTADLEGMTAHFLSVNSSVGLYSTSYQWKQIVGTVQSSSNLYSAKSWLAGSRSATDAKANCSLPPLTGGGGKVVLNQYISRGFDYNYSCL